MNNLTSAISAAASEKGIDKSVFIKALEEALLAAAKKKYPAKEGHLEVHFNEELGELELFEFKDVVEVVENAEVQLTPEQAVEQGLATDAQPGDSIGAKLEVGEFLNRIAAQNAKQIIIQKVREAEKALVYEEYKDRKGDLVNGIVRRVERGNVIVEIGRTEAIVPRSEQIPRESYRPDERIRAYVLEIKQDAKGPAIVLSRSTPNFIRKLFELEVPEIHEGVVEIKAIAREPGNRAKVAVWSHERDVDPVGACVGMKGSRVQNVVQELKGEKIDIIQWSEDPAKLIENALSPAEISQVVIDEVDKKMEVIVPDDQLSLAIGRKGQNVKLAVQLTGWNVDIRSESEMLEAGKRTKAELAKIPGISETAVELLYQAGIGTIADLTNAEPERLSQESDIGVEKVQQLIASAKQYLAEAEARDQRIKEWEAKPAAALDGADAAAAAALAAAGFQTVGQLAQASEAAVAVHGDKATALRAAARKVLEIAEPEAPAAEGAGQESNG